MPSYNEMNRSDQPCQDFEPVEMSSTGGFQPHECPDCGKMRYFCDNCHHDHHEGGWWGCYEHRYNKAQEKLEFFKTCGTIEMMNYNVNIHSWVVEKERELERLRAENEDYRKNYIRVISRHSY